ncbi:glutathione S-transferase family protein [Phyllobacterium sp. 628]|uniref:glutathione S-transferase family protein n=1 Tax=Phyllobacterium sp. 628 TaxID=2718938 RepID=UPI0016626177|nr:glutathione S-transferase family protein [Phyllobacterium sp. 628]QND51417.1 glutathione S-transferase family protein [Phyllobacterium sp. 628]
MKLLYQTHSPYARKVLVAIHESGLAGEVEVIHHETSPTRRNEDVYALNPLGKVPVLITSDGTAIFDSTVICDYIDGLHEREKLIPANGEARWNALRLQTIAQGMADSGIVVRWETERRPEELRWSVMRDAQLQKIEAACDFVEMSVDFGGPLDIGKIALGTTLSWIAFRNVYAFEVGRPKLSAWYNAFCERPSMLATTLAGETHD